MSFENLKIRSRIGFSFGVVLLLMMAAVIVGAARLHGVGDIDQQILGKDWAKADALATINATSSATARRTMELFIATDQDHLARASRTIEAERKAMRAALEQLPALADSAQEKAAVTTLANSFAGYEASLGKVAKLLEQGSRDEASGMLLKETMPALESLQAQVASLTQEQKKQVETIVAQIGQEVLSSRNLMYALGLAALLAGIACTVALVRGIVRPLDEAILIAETVTSGDLSQEFETQRRGEFGRLLRGLGEMEDTLTDLVTRIKESTDSIVVASEQITVGNRNLALRTEEQASSLQETAAAMEELTSAVKKNADSARMANDLAVSTSSLAVKGGSEVSQLVNTMDSINASSRKIVDIISVIDGIAFQTNILALNAAVEAARAGEEGRGFAVVAGEVRSLAQRAAAAAKEIKTLIGDSVEKVEEGSQRVVAAGRTIDEIVSSVARVKEIMAEISAASAEQTSEIEEINRAITQIDQVTQQNAALVEEATSAASSLQEQAGGLAHVVSTFKLDSEEPAQVIRLQDVAAVHRQPASATLAAPAIEAPQHKRLA